MKMDKYANARQLLHVSNYTDGLNVKHYISYICPAQFEHQSCSSALCMDLKTMYRSSWFYNTRVLKYVTQQPGDSKEEQEMHRRKWSGDTCYSQVLGMWCNIRFCQTTTSHAWGGMAVNILRYFMAAGIWINFLHYDLLSQGLMLWPPISSSCLFYRTTSVIDQWSCWYFAQQSKDKSTLCC